MATRFLEVDNSIFSRAYFAETHYGWRMRDSYLRVVPGYTKAVN